MVQEILHDSKLEEYENITEFWDINASSKQLSYLTHNYFRYFGKFPPTIAKKLIEMYCPNNSDLIVDTMVGSGTTLVEAILQNKKAIGFDINPFSILLSQVKTKKIDTELIQNVFLSIKDNFKKTNKSDVSNEIPDMPNMDHWFDSKLQYELAEIKYLIKNINNQDVKNFMLIGFASILRRTSSAGSHTGRLFFDKNWTYRNPYELFEKQILSMINRMTLLNSIDYPSPSSVIADARELPLENEIAKLVICHPPYYNLYRFSHTNRFEIFWLDFNHKQITKEEIFDGFKLGSVEKVDLYLEDMSKVINEMYRLVSSSGYAALMIGDSIAQNQRLNITKYLVDYMKLNQMKIHKIILRKPRYTEATFAASQRRKKEDLGHNLTDFIIVFGK